jgi:hypothetical protein
LSGVFEVDLLGSDKHQQLDRLLLQPFPSNGDGAMSGSGILLIHYLIGFHFTPFPLTATLMENINWL